MKKYTTGYSHGEYNIEEFNWSYASANRLCVYNGIDDAMEEMSALNNIIMHYGIADKRRDSHE